MSEEKEHLTRGQKAVRTKGPEGVSRGARKAANTRKIHDAKERLAAIMTELSKVEELLKAIDLP